MIVATSILMDSMIHVAEAQNTIPSFIPLAVPHRHHSKPHTSTELESSPSSRHLDHNQHYHNTRRSFFQTSFASVAFSSSLFPANAIAQGDNNNPPELIKPYASLDALLPATRVKVLIDRAIRITSDLQGIDDAKQNQQQQQLISELKPLLLLPQNFTTASSTTLPKQPAKQYLQSYKQQLDDISLLQKPGALLQQNGEVDTWKRLKRQERNREQNDEYQIRTAFNTYTSALNFNAERYALTGPKTERSKLIRDEGGVPDVKSVITSDLGMRYLYRNEILTSMEDVRAELRYQLDRQQHGDNGVDSSDLLELLKGAQRACDSWFSYIDESDVREALSVVKKENDAL